jgi:RecG-like helicase
LIEHFYEILPFALTNAQERVINDILNDLASSQPMNRLVQGDVGAAKP